MTAYPREIWYTRCPVPTPLGIAINQGVIEQDFGALGIDVRSIQDSQDPETRASHYDHHLAHSFRQGGSVPAIWARAAGADTRVIGLNWVDESQAILTLPASGIRTPRDLKGRRIALPRRAADKVDIFRATALRALLAGLSLGGVAEQDVEWIDIDAGDPPVGEGEARVGANSRRGWRGRPLYAAEFGALVRGEVDAIHVKGSLGHEYAFLAGAHVVVDTGFHPDPKIRINNGTPRPLTVDTATVDLYPDLAARLLRHVRAAGDWAENHPAETLAYIARETGSPEQFVRSAYGGDTLHRRLKTDLDPGAIDALADFAGFLFDRGFLPVPVDVPAWIDRRPLDALTQPSHAAARSLEEVSA
ncbi:ABC transporter substrate-binding protein [Allosphingosinicella deserti]|uniref:Nitrate ABC transporter substrate-binding protein n=1 Tax=Allosphingosinicella deserti TaxID=2116704 RepID=A0A2P7QYA0_9SPHN|nr:ABC transporter substrate-binding protein [Sphingomonas deserti]PSJ42936.1 nitrate ABC transporter substrate-binding protein [Sphingomonas deserti]